MRISGKWTKGCVFGVALLGWAEISGRTQWNSKGPQVSQSPNVPAMSGKDPNEAASVELQHKQEKLRQDERQKRLVSDTDKLLSLVTQLHEDVAKTDKNILSVDVIRRADEIEKLARNVKERMKS